MTARTEPTETTQASREALELLTGDFADAQAEAKSVPIETSRGTWTVYSGPCSLEDLDTVQKLAGGKEGEEVPIQNMADVLILLARTETGVPMFRPTDRKVLLAKVKPQHIIHAAEFLIEEATAALDDAEEEAGKD